MFQYKKCSIAALALLLSSSVFAAEFTDTNDTKKTTSQQPHSPVQTSDGYMRFFTEPPKGVPRNACFTIDIFEVKNKWILQNPRYRVTEWGFDGTPVRIELTTNSMYEAICRGNNIGDAWMKLTTPTYNVMYYENDTTFTKSTIEYTRPTIKYKSIPDQELENPQQELESVLGEIKSVLKEYGHDEQDLLMQRIDKKMELEELAAGNQIKSAQQELESVLREFKNAMRKCNHITSMYFQDGTRFFGLEFWRDYYNTSNVDFWMESFSKYAKLFEEKFSGVLVNIERLEEVLKSNQPRFLPVSGLKIVKSHTMEEHMEQLMNLVREEVAPSALNTEGKAEG